MESGNGHDHQKCRLHQEKNHHEKIMTINIFKNCPNEISMMQKFFRIWNWSGDDDEEFCLQVRESFIQKFLFMTMTKSYIMGADDEESHSQNFRQYIKKQVIKKLDIIAVISTEKDKMNFGILGKSIRILHVFCPMISSSFP